MPLKRNIPLWLVVLSGIGVILGAGIYVLAGKAAGIAGYGLWLAFLVAAIVAILTALSYSELASRFPKAGAEYDYTKNAFGEKTGFATGWIFIIAGLASSATICAGFGGYLQALAGVPAIIGALAIIIVCAIVIFFGAKIAVAIAGLLSIVELLGLFIVIWAGLPLFPRANIDIFAIPSVSSVFVAAALVFFAYLGFEQIVRLAEETKNPEKNIPKALLAAILISTAIYALVAISAVSLLSPQQLAESSAPLADAVATQFGSNAFLAIAIIALFSTANTALLIMLATSRLVFGMARGKKIPLVSRIERHTGTPAVALALCAIASAALLPLGGIEFTANLTNLFLFLGFAIVNLALIKIRLRPETRQNKKGFSVPLSLKKVPVPTLLGATTCIFLVAMIEWKVIALGTAIIIAGLALNEVKKGKRKTLKKKAAPKNAQ